MKYLLASEIVDKVIGAPLTAECPDCEREVLTSDLHECCDCHHICCEDCLMAHCAQPHLDDYDNSPYAHGAWRTPRYDA